jgi:O-antigen/teichoic acid export membrane protein
MTGKNQESSDILAQEITTKKSLIKNGIWATYGAFGVRFLALINNLILARLLLPSEFGVIGVAYIFWSFVNLFAQDAPAAFIVYKGTEDKRCLNTAYTINVSFGIVLAVGLVLASPLIAGFFGIPDLVGILVGFALNLVLSFYQSTYVGILRSQMRFQELTNATLIASFVRVLSTVGFALLGLSYWSFVLGDMTNWIISTILLRRQVKEKLKLQIDRKNFREILSYTSGAIGLSLGYYVNSNVDNFVVGKFLGATSLGYYNLAYQLTMALSIILSQIVHQFGASAFKQMANDKEQENALLKVVEQIAILVTPIHALFFLIIDKQAISLIFGEKWTPVSALIPWLLIFAYFRVINSAIGSMLNAKGLPGVSAKVNLIISPIAVLCFAIGAIQGKMLGVSISVAIVLGILWTCCWWWVGCRELGWSMTKFTIPCVQGILMTILCTFLSYYLPLMIRPLIFVIAYIVLIRLFYDKYYRQYQGYLGKVFRKI